MYFIYFFFFNTRVNRNTGFKVQLLSPVLRFSLPLEEDQIFSFILESHGKLTNWVTVKPVCLREVSDGFPQCAQHPPLCKDTRTWWREGSLGAEPLHRDESDFLVFMALIRAWRSWGLSVLMYFFLYIFFSSPSMPFLSLPQTTRAQSIILDFLPFEMHLLEIIK